MAGRKVKQEMSKNLEAKKVVVSEISEKLKNCQSMVVVHFNGITVEEVTELRNQFRAAGVEYCVLKNTLVRRALEEAGATGILSKPFDPMRLADDVNRILEERR